MQSSLTFQEHTFLNSNLVFISLHSISSSWVCLYRQIYSDNHVKHLFIKLCYVTTVVWLSFSFQCLKNVVLVDTVDQDWERVDFGHALMAE